MTTFLQLVAQSLYERFGSNMSRVTIVFPGKRASLFFDQALTELSATPVWAPRYTTISELFQQASPFTLCDTVEGVCRLYRSYAKAVADPQSLDHFYGWGEVLLADFDDVDKHLADAKSLFANIRDIKALDDNSYITEEQEAALKAFFKDFSVENNTLLKERFLELWNNMFTIYDDLNASMRADGVLYEGALQREVVSRMKQLRFAEGDSDDSAGVLDSHQTYVFVGFNVLNDVEQALFDELQRRGQALFYWDYDTYYTDASDGTRHEAGYFILANIKRYGNALPPEHFSHLCEQKQLTMVAASSENIQARYLPQWLSANLTEPENQTAVVLANEQLLLPVLHAIPPSVTSLNVTMGYALTDTPVSSFINVLFALYTDGYDAARRRYRPSALRAVRSHPLSHYLEESSWLCEVDDGRALLIHIVGLLAQLGLIFSKAIESEATEPSEGTEHPATTSDTEDKGDARVMATLYSEAVFVAYTRLNRLVDLMSGSDPLLAVGTPTLRRLISVVLQSQSIPFHGEPAVGLQVMGVLETRALDFRHILMLSVGEGFLPKSTSDTSFIPYNLKEAFGLTTMRHKIAVYAYYFYRLIQRSEHVTFVYNESNSGLRQNELSRFLRQLQADPRFTIEHLRLEADSDVVLSPDLCVAKSADVMQRLLRRFECNGLTEEERQRHLLSPSALKKYTTCPMQFYFHYVKGIKDEPDTEDGFQAVHFGKVFHRAAELLYLHLTSKGDVVRKQDLEAMLELGGQRLEGFVSQAFREEFFEDRPEEYTGILLIARRVLITYLTQLLRYDSRIAPIRVLGTELLQTGRYYVNVEGRDVELCIGGIIDRLDQVADADVAEGQVIRVVDYKTGGNPNKAESLEKLFHETVEFEHHIFQTILYGTIVESQRHMAVVPCLFYLHKSGADDYSPKVKIRRTQVNDIRQPLEEGEQPLNAAFEQHLQTLLNEIFDPEVPFRQTSNADACTFCVYKLLCGR